jgi:hypothetical protein
LAKGSLASQSASLSRSHVFKSSENATKGDEKARLQKQIAEGKPSAMLELTVTRLLRAKWK